LHIETGKAAEGLESLLMAIVQIELSRQRYDQSALGADENQKLWL
jgi:hypothetical protein